MDRNEIIQILENYINENNMNNIEIVRFIENLSLEILADKYKDRDGLFILKKAGLVEEFSKTKLYYSIANASDEAEMVLNESDINLIINSLMKYIDKLGRNVISTKELRNYISKLLKETGYDKVEKFYNS